MKQIGTTSFGRIHAWWERAVATPHVRRFMSFEPYLPEPSLSSVVGWSSLDFLSDDGATYLALSINHNGPCEVHVGLWSLQTNPMRRRFAAGVALRTAKDEAARLSARVVTFSAHETNTDCLYLARRKFGPEWGIQPEGAWDCELGRFVAMHRFQVLVRDWAERARQERRADLKR